MNDINDYLIYANNISKVFNDGDRDLQVLNKLDFKLKQGERVAVLGSSGSGKSTLLHILAGLDNPTTGVVNIDNNNLNELSENKRASLRNKHLGFIYQFHHLLPEFSAIENIAMPLLIRGDEFDLAFDKAAEQLEKIGLTDRAEHRPGQLSGGERQRVAIARALITEPQCIFADEPTGNLDEDNAKNVFNLLLELNKQTNTSIVLVTHDSKLAEQLDQVYTLNHGALS